ncbi:hypothetical protein O181_019935 [Austropuccinia psidii MF-1]|uniref:Cora-domain-containing protein n=1 Tax=Austropuccinia psidii MF-1 TaxID=1389203 RepID=A0A9Q3GVL0_9BASI|nr:hypothetical protein [Austropuccinia psidii MF-1]
MSCPSSPTFLSSSSSSLNIDPSILDSNQPYSDLPKSTPSKSNSFKASKNNQLEQDVQAAFHFSRARSNTISNNNPTSPSKSSHSLKSGPNNNRSEQVWDDLLNLSNPNLIQSSSNPQLDQDVQFFLNPNSNSNLINSSNLQSNSIINNPNQPISLLDLPIDQSVNPLNQFQAINQNLSEISFDSSHGALIDHRNLKPIISSPLSPNQKISLKKNNSSSSNLPSTQAIIDSNPISSSTQKSSSILSTDHHQTSSFVSSTHSNDQNLSSNQSSSHSHSGLLSDHKFQSNSSRIAIPSLMAFSQKFQSPIEPANRTLQSHWNPSNHSRLHSSIHPHENSNHNIENECDLVFETTPRVSLAEEDVCFPRLEADRQLANELQPNPSNQHHSSNPLQPCLAGLLPNFPFPFDFRALEEFAQQERAHLTPSLPSQSNPTQDSRRLRPPSNERLDARIPRSNELDEPGLGGGSGSGDEELMTGEDLLAVKAGVRRRKIGFLPSSTDKTDESGISDRRPIGVGGRMGILKHRRLNDDPGLMTSRQRKLALFEGIGPLGGISNNLQANSADGSAIVNSKNALDSRNVFSRKPSRSGNDQVQRGRAGQVHWMNNERPYRFSFYSNALPSTIHARSLAEILSEGQTFEDLFTGRTNYNKKSMAEHASTTLTSKGPKQLGKMNQSVSLIGRNNSHESETSSNPPISEVGLNSKMAESANGNKPRTGVLMRTDEDAEANTWWLDVLCPTDQEMKLLSKVFGIHPLTTEDIQMEETREKIELFRNYYLVCFRSFDQDPYSPTYLEPLNMYIIVFREGTLSFHFRGTPHPQNVRRRIKHLKDYINVTSDWISYALIDDITDAFGPLIQSIEYEVDSIDELVLILKDAEQSDMLRRIGTCRKKVMGLLRLMGNKADVVRGLSKRCNENWSVAPKSDIGLYLSDIQDHLVTMTQNLNHYEKILSRSHSNYLAQISIEMTDANNQINDVLSKLTALGSILVPMNLVTGLWGMNVHVPGQDITEGYAWFISIVCGLVSFGIIGAYLTLRYLKFSNK